MAEARKEVGYCAATGKRRALSKGVSRLLSKSEKTGRPAHAGNPLVFKGGY